MKSIEDVLELMAALRDPETGCTWNRKQDFQTIVPYTLEEAYEVADAIEQQDMDGLRNELGDLLFQVIYHAQIAGEQGYFTFADIVAGLHEKIRQRNPHVFAENQPENPPVPGWEQVKIQEQQAADTGGDSGILDRISRKLPALRCAQKLQSRAAAAGFDWDHIQPVLAKLEEEIQELQEAITSHKDPAVVRSELGDILFCCVNLARHLEIDAETALRSSNHKFADRFGFIESRLKERGESMQQVTLDDLDKLWEEAKQAGF